MMHYYSTPVLIFQPERIDAENGILHNVVVAETGEVRSYNERIDGTTLAQIADFGNRKPKGLKARFGHPNMFANALGSYIGRFKNFQVVGEKVIADLHLDLVAKESPKGNLYEYVLKMAENNPDMFGASIAFVPAKTQKYGNDILPATRIDSLVAADLVDEPAATNSLFENGGLAAERYLQVGEENKELVGFVEKKPEAIFEFLFKYFENKKNMGNAFIEKMRKIIGNDVDAEPDIAQDEKNGNDDGILMLFGNTVNLIRENEELKDLTVCFFEDKGSRKWNMKAEVEKGDADELTVVPVAKMFEFVNGVIKRLNDDNGVLKWVNGELMGKIETMKAKQAANPVSFERHPEPALKVDLQTKEVPLGKQIIGDMPSEHRTRLTRLKNKNQDAGK